MLIRTVVLRKAPCVVIMGAPRSRPGLAKASSPAAASIPPSRIQKTRTPPAPDDQAGQEFDAGRFRKWLRLLLVSFYSDEEAVLADFLCGRATLMKDTVLARSLNLPERQVRQLLEARLVPDCLIEKRVEGTGAQLQTFYRISPISIAVAAKRLQVLENTLAGKVQETYMCSKCSRVYTSLEALSVSFVCGNCDEALASSVGDTNLSHDRLRRFRSQCKELLQLTAELKDSPGPQFDRQEKVKQRAPKAILERAVEKAPPAAAPVSATHLMPSLSPASGSLSKDIPQKDDGAHWFHQEVLGTTSLGEEGCGQVAETSKDAAAASKSKEVDKELQLELASAKRARNTLLEERLTKSHASPALQHTVLVQGVAYSLTKVLEDEDLQDEMTDDEYQRFVDLDKSLQRQQLLRR